MAAGSPILFFALVGLLLLMLIRGSRTMVKGIVATSKLVDKMLEIQLPIKIKIDKVRVKTGKVGGKT